jgi:carboxypeptidase family protein
MQTDTWFFGQRAAVVATCLAALVLSAAAPAGAQNVTAPVRDPRQPTVQRPPRDRQPAPVTGTGVLSGRVVDAVTGRAVARARVRLQGGAQRSSTLTDDGGAFSFAELPPGGYSLFADKSGYLPGRFPDPGRSLRNRSQTIQLANGQTRDDIIVSMFRGGVIAGRVLDAHGDPVEGAMVSIMSAPKNGRPTMRNGTQTNDLGEFRAIRLAAGRYIVRVRPPNSFQGDPFGNEQPLPQPLPAYYPAALSLDGAQAIVVNRGETITGVDVVLGEGLPSIVSGVVLGLEAQPSAPGQGTNMNINGSVSARTAGAVEGFVDSGGPIRPDGTFRLQLPPGDYVLEAQASPMRPGQQPRPDTQVFGSARIVVGTGPVENVTIALGAGATATGRIVFEGSTPPPPSPGQTRVPLFMSPEGGGQGCRPPMATISDDWSFRVEGLVGTCAMQPGAMMGRWSVKSVTFRDRDLADSTITFEPGQQFSNVQIVVTDKRTQVELRVADESGQPTSDFVALVFPANKEKWAQIARYMRTIVPPPITARATAAVPPGVNIGMQTGMVGSLVTQGGLGVGSGNAMQSMSFAQNGTSRLQGLQPGEYFAIALDDIDPEDSQDPEVLARLAENGVRFTVSYDGPVEVPVRRAKLADIIR